MSYLVLSLVILNILAGIANAAVAAYAKWYYTNLPTIRRTEAA